MPMKNDDADRLATGVSRFKQVIEGPKPLVLAPSLRRVTREASASPFILSCFAMLLVTIGLGRNAIGADAEKDPRGWNGVALGMTKQEVLDALGGRGHLDHRRNRPKPLMLNTGDWADLPAAKAAASKLVDQENPSPAMQDRIAAAEKVLDLLKPRDWMIVDLSRPPINGRSRPSRLDAPPAPAPSRPPTNGRRKPRVLEKIKGTLAHYRSLGAHGREVFIQQKNIETPVKPERLDEASNEYLIMVDQAINQLSGMIAESEVATEGEVIIAPVEIRGIELRPEINFEGNAVVGISLCTPGADNPMTRVPNLSGIHRTLCEALSEKYGPADEKNETGETFVALWRFSKTNIRCTQSRFGICITYEAPDSGRQENRDNL